MKFYFEKAQIMNGVGLFASHNVLYSEPLNVP